jgi:hypothetical protein
LRALLTLDGDLVICAKTVEVYAKADVHLGEALAAAGGFSRTPRGAIMVFLIVSMSAAAGLGIGQCGAWSGYGSSATGKTIANLASDGGTRYIKFLPKVSIPTTWTDAERKLLRGTSLNVVCIYNAYSTRRQREVHMK